MGARHLLPDSRVSRFLLLYILPFSYGAATRVPFVFASLHCVLVLGASLPTLAGVLGCYQVSRILGNYLVGALGPHVALPLGAAAGLIGYASMACSTALFPAVGPGATAACLALVGLSETITALQFFAKKTYAADPVRLRSNLLRLYACNVAGTCVAFLGSAMLYDRYGITGSACFGAGLEACLFFGSLVYLSLCARKRRAMPSRIDLTADSILQSLKHNSNSKSNSQTPHGQTANGHANPFAAVADKQVPECDTLRDSQSDAGVGADDLVLQLSRSMSLHSSSQLTEGVNEEYTHDPDNHLRAQLLGDSFVIPEGEPVCATDGGDDKGCLATPPVGRLASKLSPATSQDVGSAAAAVPAAAAAPATEAAVQDHAPWVNYVLAMTFCAQAVLIGTILSTAPLLLHDALGLGVLHVGFAFAAGEALGSAALLFNSTQFGQALVRRILPLPLGLLWVLSLMGLLTITLPLMGLLRPCVRSTFALVNLVLLMGLNDIGTSFTGECQGAALPERHFSHMNVLGNMLRRLGNTVTCALGPLVYQLHMRAPFVLFGAITLAWVVLLAALLALRARQVARGMEENINCRSTRSALNAATSMYGDSRAALLSIGSDLRRYNGMSFISQERKYWSSVAQEKAA